MISPFNVTKRKPTGHWWQVLLFTLMLMGLLWVLFPPDLLMKSVLNNIAPNDVSVQYLKNLVAQDPSNVDYKLMLAEQEYQLGQVDEAQQLINPLIPLSPNSQTDWKISLLHYNIAQVKAFKLPENSLERLNQEAQLKKLLQMLLSSPYLTADESVRLADDSLAFDKPQLALNFYKKAINKHIIKPVSFYEKIAKITLFTKDFEDGAELYLLAMDHSAAMDDKRLYFIKAVDTLNAEGSAKKALDFAQKNKNWIRIDTATFIYLIKLANQAGQQKMAEQFVNQMLHLTSRDEKK